MKTAIISAKYTEQGPLEKFFAEVFGINKAEVRFTRGRYQCTIPRGLNKQEMERLGAAVTYEHYKES